MDCLLLDLVSNCSRLQTDLPQEWMRAHLRMDCRPCFAVPVPFLLSYYPRLLSRTDNIGLSEDAMIRGYDAGETGLLPGCCRGVAGAGTERATLKATLVRSRQSAVQLASSLARDFCCKGICRAASTVNPELGPAVAGRQALLLGELAGSG